MNFTIKVTFTDSELLETDEQAYEQAKVKALEAIAKQIANGLCYGVGTVHLNLTKAPISYSWSFE